LCGLFRLWGISHFWALLGLVRQRIGWPLRSTKKNTKKTTMTRTRTNEDGLSVTSCPQCGSTEVKVCDLQNHINESNSIGAPPVLSVSHQTYKLICSACGFRELRLYRP
jgi:predicted RNA-binding Zn-ribbon protein involved in translation (DUF1610 family)